MSKGVDLLRQSREDKGWSIEALSAAIKVSPSKLQALEAGRFEEFPNAAFVRALAMTVCRALKVDPAPVLSGLPLPDNSQLLVDTPAQEPFRSSRTRLNLDAAALLPGVKGLLKPKYLVPVFILLAAVGVYHWPQGGLDLLPARESLPAPAQAAPDSLPVLAPPKASAGVLPSVVADAPVATVDPSASSSMALGVLQDTSALPPLPVDSGVIAPQPAASSADAGAMKMEVTGETWAQVKDASGAVLLRRLLLPDERISLDGTPPFKVKLGNASAVRLYYRGQPVDLSEHTRANVAKVELN